MFLLAREVRFCVDPLAPEQVPGDNSYAGCPAGSGLGLFLALEVTVRGPLDAETGFVLNVCDIDRAVRDHAIGLFVDRITNLYGRRRRVTLKHLAELLQLSRRVLDPAVAPADLAGLSLRLTPYRRLTLTSEAPAVTTFSERFEFAAMHKLWNDRLSTARNREVFGKCANPAGHGHNYVLEVTVRSDGPEALDPCVLERIVNERLINELDHRSLNADVPHFREVIPTMENIARYAWQRLVEVCRPLLLHEITVWESDRTRCTYRGPAA